MDGTVVKFKQAKRKHDAETSTVRSFGLAFSAIARSYDAPSEVPGSILQNEPDPGRSWYIEGFASTQDIDLSRYADPEIQPSGLRMSETSLQNLVDWTKTLSTVFKNHDLEEEIGRVVEAEVREGKMWVKILISKTRPDIWQRILEGVLNKFSVQFIPQTWHFEDDTVTGKPVRVIDTAVGLETSVVGLPMNQMADIAAAYAASFLSNLQKPGAAGDKMDRNQLIEQIKAHVAQLSDPVVDAEIAGEIRATIAQLYSALRVIDATVPDPMSMSINDWALTVEVKAETAGGTEVEVKAEQVKPEVEVEVEAGSPAATADAPALTIAAAVAAATEGAASDAPAAPLSPEANQELVALGAAVGTALSTITRGVIPMAAVIDMACLEESLATASVPERVRAKAKQMLVDMFKMVSDAVETEKKSAAATDLGSVVRSFEAQSQKLLNQFATAMEENKKLAAQAAQAASEAAALQKQNQELLVAIEKKSAEIRNLTVSGPNGPSATPPSQQPVNMSDQASRVAMWLRAGPLPTGN